MRKENADMGPSEADGLEDKGTYGVLTWTIPLSEDQLSPIRTGCPPPPAQSCSGVSKFYWIMERWSSNTITFTTMRLSAAIIQPVLLRTNAALFDTSALSTFARRMECSPTLHTRKGLRISLNVYILSVYVDEV